MPRPSRRFRAAPEGFESRFALSAGMSGAPPPIVSFAETGQPFVAEVDPFEDPFTPDEPAPAAVDDGPGPDAGVCQDDDPFGPDPEPLEPEPPDFDGDQPPGVSLPPIPTGPAGPAF